MKLRIARSVRKIINDRRSTAPVRIAFITLAALISLISVVQPGGATGTITRADLSGPWAATWIGNSGCGFGTNYFTFTLNTAGSGSGTDLGLSSGCGSTNSTFTFAINSLNPNGSGTATIGCGVGCGWSINFQVAPDRSLFNFVDITNGGNELEGTAIHQ